LVAVVDPAANCANTCALLSSRIIINKISYE
jgi:hypothetical protein